MLGAIGQYQSLFGSLWGLMNDLGHGGLSNLGDVEHDLHSYLQGARETLVWKLEGLGEYDIRRPLTPTGTNLLGLVKHSAGTELNYFGAVFGRRDPVLRSRRLTAALQRVTGSSDANAGMWPTADETREEIVDRYRSAWAIADATITA